MTTPSGLRPPEIAERLSAMVGAEHVSTSPPDLRTYATDLWPKTQIWRMGGDLQRYPPDAIVWPANEREVSQVLAFLNEARVPVVPFGGGSGVCGGTLPLHGGVVVDLKRLRRVRDLDHDSLTVTAEAGINGQHLEDHLNVAGTTLGHFPSSIMCSTLGGWLAARSGGQYSSKYGKIEDMVLGCRVALPDGRVLDTADRGPGDPDWTQLIVGSEGTLGLITQAKMRIHRVPESRHLRGFRFRSLAQAFGGMRAVMQAGLAPTVLRLYDPFDSFLAMRKAGEETPRAAKRAAKMLAPVADLLTGSKAASSGRARAKAAKSRLGNAALSVGLSRPQTLNRLAHAFPASCLLIIGFEGRAEPVKRDIWRARQLLVEAGAHDAGTEIGEQWLARRYSVSFKQTGMYGRGAWVDTMEVATTWDRLGPLHDAVVKAVSPLAFIMAHFSHAYREGCSIYFTFAGMRRDPGRAEELYNAVWQSALDAVHGVGATASHHHGVGISKMHAMPAEHGEMLRVYYALKRVLDPHGILNPGKLFPPDPAAQRAMNEGAA